MKLLRENPRIVRINLNNLHRKEKMLSLQKSLHPAFVFFIAFVFLEYMALQGISFKYVITSPKQLASLGIGCLVFTFTVLTNTIKNMIIFNNELIDAISAVEKDLALSDEGI